jgi:hypothetical protein
MLFLFSHNLCDLIYLYFVVENVCLDYCWLCSMWFIELLVSMISVCMCCDRDCYEYDDKSVIVFTCVFVWLNILLLSGVYLIYRMLVFYYFSPWLFQRWGFHFSVSWLGFAIFFQMMLISFSIVATDLIWFPSISRGVFFQFQCVEFWFFLPSFKCSLV